MLKRKLSSKIKELAKKMPVVALVGPRQSGKTTLAQQSFPKYRYVSFEDLDIRRYATQDPRGFLADYTQGAIFDEIQRVPTLFSYIQTLVDKQKKPGQFILTGSQHFLLLENVSQSLAGRVALLNLLPLSLEELTSAACLPASIEALLFKGCYPRIYQHDLDPVNWYADYVRTYIERDIRQIKNVHDLSSFQQFIKMCAGRTGQLLNLSSLANDCGITHNTAKAWISLLETSFIVFLLRPYHNNVSKQLVKSPKLYFYDTGLVCSLLGIEAEKQLHTHPLKGNIFENFVISELIKFRYNRGLQANAYFWRDKLGHEVDCLLKFAEQLVPIEIKAGKTVAEDFFKGLRYWNQRFDGDEKKSYVIYGGDSRQKRFDGNVLGWRNMLALFNDLKKKI